MPVERPGPFAPDGARHALDARIHLLLQIRRAHAAMPAGVIGFVVVLRPWVDGVALAWWMAAATVNFVYGLAAVSYDLRSPERATSRACTVRLVIGCGSFAVTWGALTPLSAWWGGDVMLPWGMAALMGMASIQLLVTTGSRALYAIALAGLLGPVSVLLAAWGMWDRVAVMGVYAAAMLVLNHTMATAQERLRATRDELAEANDRLAHQADHDPLTGLANRRAFTAHLDTAVLEGRHPAVVFVDLDLFKPVNDELGHEAGDELLRAVAERISARLRPGDVAARWGGDEFVVLLRAPVRADEAHAVAAAVVDDLAAPFTVVGRSVGIGGSAGVAVAAGEDTGTDLLARADDALAAAKAAGRGRVVVAPGAGATRAGATARRPAGWAVLDLLTDPVVVVDDDGIVVHLNPAVTLALGLRPAERVGRPVSELLDADGDDDLAVTVRDVHGTRHRWRLAVSDARSHAAVRGLVIVAHPLERVSGTALAEHR
jgi:diguanylate cyclase (GGDEF)-like protein